MDPLDPVLVHRLLDLLIGSLICFWSMIHGKSLQYHVLAGLRVCAWKASPVTHCHEAQLWRPPGRVKEEQVWSSGFLRQGVFSPALY